MRTFAVKTFVLAALVGAIAVGAFPAAVLAQTSTAVAPTYIPVSGRLLRADGQPRSGEVVQLVVSLYDGQSDTAPRWIEQQEITLDASGGYNVQFGATLPDGLPLDLFAADAGARWLGVGVQNIDGSTVEQPRVMLVSVPYAAKAASAETLGGRSAGDFVLTSTFREDLRTVLEEEGVKSGSGVGSEAVSLNYLQKGDGLGGTTDSVVYESNSRIGVGSTNPLEKLEVLSDTYHALGFGTVTAGRVGLLGWLNTAANPVPGVFSHSSAYRLALGTNRSEQMTIATNGSVGIGTTSPNAKLHVAGSFQADGRVGVGTTSTPQEQVEVLSNNLHAIGWGTATAGRVGLLGWLNTAAAPVPGVFSHSAAYRLALGANRQEHLTITPAGNIGIGTINPVQKLDVVGNIVATGTISGDNVIAKYQDVAEWVDAAEPLEAGTVVIIDVDARNRVTTSNKANDPRVAGAVSPQPGLILGERGEGRVLVAQSGRVRIKADTRNGAIKPGDLLVTAPRAGYAMKAKSAKPGTVLGKALEPLEKGTGEILVLLTLQ